MKINDLTRRFAYTYDSNERMTEAVETVRDTKDRILDAAEGLFSRQGFAATSLRQITGEARVNLAAVNYHFQSKEALIVAVIQRKMGPINERRLALLDALESDLPEQAPELERVVWALFRPVFEARLLGVELGNFPRLMGRMFTEPGDWVQRVLGQALGGILERFGAAARRALPGLRQEDLGWGMLFSVGAMAHHLAGGEILRFLSRGQSNELDQEEALDRLVRFTSAGLRAMATGREMRA